MPCLFCLFVLNKKLYSFLLLILSLKIRTTFCQKYFKMFLSAMERFGAYFILFSHGSKITISYRPYAFISYLWDRSGPSRLCSQISNLFSINSSLSFPSSLFLAVHQTPSCIFCSSSEDPSYYSWFLTKNWHFFRISPLQKPIFRPNLSSFTSKIS